MMSEHLDEFVKCLDEQRYYDAHEVLEVVWFPRRFEDCSEIKLLRCFINAAVSFELAKKGREAASEKVWKNFLKYRKLLPQVESPLIKQYHSLVSYIEAIEPKTH